MSAVGSWTIAVALVVAGVIHVMPVTGVLGPHRLAALYGIRVDDPSLDILMRHRGLVLSFLGVLLLAAAVRPSLQPIAIVAGLGSAASFLAIAWGIGGYNPAVAAVVRWDVVATVALIVAAVLRVAMTRIG